MKKYLILAFACLAAFGCDESSIDPLSGVYPVPQNLEFATVRKNSRADCVRLPSSLNVLRVRLTPILRLTSISLCRKPILSPSLPVLTERISILHGLRRAAVP